MESTKNVQCKHFPVDTERSYVQFEISMTENEFNELTQGQTPTSESQGKVLIQCLDRSGSMAGQPFQAVQEGASKLCEAIFCSNDRPFDRFITVLYDNKISVYESDIKQDYIEYIKKQKVNGSTNFKKVFQYLSDFIEENQGELKELTIIFFTDGCDTCNLPKQQVQDSLDQLQALISENKMQFSTRFLTIGFSKEHDAQFMNQIAQAGSELGNFFYIQSSGNKKAVDYGPEVTTCLTQSLEIAIESQVGNKLIITDSDEQVIILPLQSSYVFEVDPLQEKPPVITGTLLTGTKILPTSKIDSFLTTLQISDQKIPYQLQVTEVSDPNDEVTLKAKLQNANERIFELIQQVQIKVKRKVSLEQLKQLDSEVEMYVKYTHKIRDKTLRKEFMEQITDCKSKLSQILQLLRKAVNESFNLNNNLVAELNDFAYKAIRKQAAQKRLDSRALKNEGIFKANDQKLQAISMNLDEQKVYDKHQDLIDQIGVCPITQSNVLDLILSNDCMGLCLQITRSQAVINDPSKLIIKAIVPTFMSCDSFMESSLFNLEKNRDASGGFDYKKQGKLAMGVSGQQVSGLLPLYLFKEHKQVVKLKIQPLYGFMTCLDPMGYTSSQAFTIPYLVLIKAISDYDEKPCEINKFVLKLVSDTCIDMIKSNEAHKKAIIEQANMFMARPEHRTADVVNSIQLLTAQILTFDMLPKEQQVMKNIDPQERNEDTNTIDIDFQAFSRFAVEEIARRSIKKDAEPFGKEQILNILLPCRADIAQEYKQLFEDRLFKALNMDDSQNNYDEFEQKANELQQQVDKQLIDPCTEESKNLNTNSNNLNQQFVTKEGFIRQVIGMQNWIENLKNKNSQASKLFTDTLNDFDKHQKPFLLCVKQLLKSDKPMNAYELLGSNDKLILAILLQNAMHPKNNQRVEAIKNSQYKQILTVEDAEHFFANIIDQNLMQELLTIESQCKLGVEKQLVQKGQSLVFNAPSIFYSAAVMLQESFYNGKGNRSAFLDYLLRQDPTQITDLYSKLQLIVSGEFQGQLIYKDKKWVAPYKNLCKKTAFKLWLHLCRINKVLEVEQMVEIAPYLEDKFMLWHMCVGPDGKVVAGIPEYRDYFDKRAQRIKMEKIQREADKNNKAKI